MSFTRKVKNKLKREFPWLLKLAQKMPFLQQKAVYYAPNLYLKPLPNNVDEINFEQIKFNGEPKPLVSIVIAVHNKWPYTIALLQCLANHESKFSFEVIVINDASIDETTTLLTKIMNIKVIENPSNLGFLKSCNLGVHSAKGKYILMLNNDTQPQNGWLDALVDTLENDPKIGLVGSNLIYANGSLQESGGIIWADGSGNNYGRLQNRAYPQYNFVRNTDYLSGASILISKQLYELLGGFDERYCPAYYEDTDIAMQVREAGYEVKIQPQSQIVHFEGISSGTNTSTGIKQYQEVNKVKFYEKWQKTLSKKHLPPKNDESIVNFIKKNGQKVILIAEYWVPKYDQNSGANRLFHIITILKKLNHYVIYMPDDGEYCKPYTTELQQMGVHVLYNNVDKTAIEHLQDLLKYVDIAWLCNPTITSKYAKMVKETRPQAKICYDTIDLHYVRMQREAQLAGKSNEKWQKMEVLETQLANEADCVLAISQEEAEKLANITKKPIFTVPNIHKHVGGGTAFENREGLVFIGGYHHAPNIDAANYLVTQIMPKVWEHIPSMKLYLLGSHPTIAVQDYGIDSRIVVPGFIADVTSYFHNCRVFISPLRYGAGMKGKIGQALEYGLPIISTDIGIEGMFLEHKKHVLVANDAENFAKNILELYENKELWQILSANSEVALEPFSIPKVSSEIEKIINKLG